MPKRRESSSVSLRVRGNVSDDEQDELGQLSSTEDIESDEEFLPNKQPRLKLKGILDPTPINYHLRFEDLGGLDDQIRIIKESVIFRQENAASLKRSGLKHAIGGILLEGPPGTGKTICAHTIAAELSRRSRRKYTFFTHNAVESYSKWMGESEKDIQKLFESAADNKPAIIFFDEFDSVCPRRDNLDRSGHCYRTIVGTLLSQFNKIQDNDTIIIATTNLKENIDPAMLRNGRFDFIIHFPLPNEIQRKEILQIKMKNYSVDHSVFEYLAKQTNGFSGSSLTFLCEEAKLNAFKRQKDELRRKPLKSVVKQDFAEVFRSIQLPKQMANAQTDVLLDTICSDLEKILRPRTFSAEDIINNNTLDSNCFLIWSKDSDAVLNKKIIPKVLERLNQPVFRISEEIFSKYERARNFSPDDSIDFVIKQAKSCSIPSIVFVENIDALDARLINPTRLYQTLKYLGDSYIFVLCTSSVQTGDLPEGLQNLFKPFGIDRSYRLPETSESLVSKCLENVFETDIQPILSGLPVRISHSKKRSFGPQTLVKNALRISGEKSFQRISDLRDEIRNLCKASLPTNLANDIMSLFEQ